MKKCLLIILSSLILLSGCGAPHTSKEGCFNCSKKPAFMYQLNGQEISLCKDCYETELQALEQEKINSQYGIYE